MAVIRQIGVKKEQQGFHIGLNPAQRYEPTVDSNQWAAKMRVEKAEYERIVGLVEATTSNPAYAPPDKVARNRVVALLGEAAWRARDGNLDMAIALTTEALEKAKANVKEVSQ
jgi:FtsP/CotA-like multicopper oxidase with cupredoxin domain